MQSVVSDKAKNCGSCQDRLTRATFFVPQFASQRLIAPPIANDKFRCSIEPRHVFFYVTVFKLSVSRYKADPISNLSVPDRVPGTTWNKHKRQATVFLPRSILALASPFSFVVLCHHCSIVFSLEANSREQKKKREKKGWHTFGSGLATHLWKKIYHHTTSHASLNPSTPKSESHGMIYQCSLLFILLGRRDN